VGTRTSGSGQAHAGQRAPDRLLYESEHTRVHRLALPDGSGSVVAKEPLGAGARERLRHETAILERLAGVTGVPRLTTALSMPGALVVEDCGGARPKQPLDVPELLTLGIGLADVVAAVHRRGVVHKDINPANILDRGPVLIDFDLATTFADERPSFTHQSEIAGTLAYLAPEQTGRMGRPVDQRADLYALGATLYALATGRPPFGDGDSLQLIHDHLARVPEPPAERSPAVPAALSAIIMRLLEKEPDRRYQSAEGLAHDLARVRTEPDGFALAERDFPLRLSPPSRLVGRDRELGALRAAFADGARAVLVAGAPGAGKTALIDELRPIVTAQGGWFVAGKFDQYRQDAAADAVSQAMRALARLMLAEPEAELDRQRERLLGALGPSAGLAAGLAPEMASLLGVAPRPPSGDPVEIERQLFQLGVDLLCTVASPERPVVMVLDDLQWAAPTPIAFVDSILTDERLRGFLLAGTYREGEVGPEHPLSLMMPRWERLGVAPRVLPVRNLIRADLGALLREMLRLPATQAAGLAAVIGERTDGNPYETVELVNALRRDDVLAPGPTGWTWDGAAVRRYVGRGDVAHVLAARIERLPDASRAVLDVLACLGGQVPTDLLRAATGRSARVVAARLAPALEDGLLVQERDEVRFRHDRVQQAAHARLDADRRTRLHLSIARRLAGLPEWHVEAGEQYLPAVEQVRDADERRRAAGLFRHAARNVRLVNYPLADRFLSAALALLAPVESAVDAPLLADLEIDRHATLYGLGRLDEADAVYRSIEQRGTDPLRLVDAACVQVNSLTNRGRPADAVAIGRALLDRLGLARVGVDIDRPAALSAWMAGAEELCDPARPDTRDPGVLGVAKLLNTLQAPAFFADPLTYAQHSLVSQRLLAEHGPCPDLIASLETTPPVIIGRWEDYGTAYRAARQLLAVAEARGYTSVVPLAGFVFGGFCAHWFERLEDGIGHLERARDGLLHTGDLQTACFTYLATVPALLDCAPTLESCAAEVESGLSFAARTGNDHVAESLVPYQRLLRALRGLPADPGAPPDNPIAQAFFHLNEALAAALSGDGPALWRHSGAVLPVLRHIPGFSSTVLAYLLRGLALADRARAVARHEQPVLLAELDACRQWLAARAADAPANFGHLRWLLEAEHAWAAGNRWGALTAFDRAACLGEQRPWHRALIAERAAAFRLRHGHEHAGRTLLAEARRCYESWGATAKVAALDQEHPFLRGETARRDSGTTFSADAIDLLAVLEAARALSSETHLDRLRGRVVEVLSALTGATSVRLVVWDQDRHGWFLPSDGDAVPVDEASLPMSVFRYAERTREPLLVADATGDDRFARDPYLAGLERCSLLAVPILTRGAPRAMLVLENRLSSGAFTADRLDAVILIAGQLAVSLDNALVYASLERKVAERTEALAAANRRLEQLSVTDALTGLANRRCLEERTETEWRRALRSRTTLAAALVDIDHFKLYNDHYGHLAGDDCLRNVAEALRQSVRVTDLVARYGGEEFALILPDTDVDGAYVVAERARAAVAALEATHARAPSGIVTVSVGVAAVVPVDGVAIEQLVKAADTALYEAKRAGRNQVCGA
jgi:diguanylate cyclase (GGDEF)-like protein